ncbi:MAG: IS21 family transposase [Deltaproteobacteria bacterium]|nr:IS21 family transposase [Deltaproteobacteria bacterium]
MYEYRQVIYRMRQGESDRGIAKAGLIGRRKAAELRQLAKERGWLDKGPLPEDRELAEQLKTTPAVSASRSQVLPYADDVEKWFKNGIQGTTIHQALDRKYGFSGSYSCVRRYLATLKQENPEATTILEFEPAEAAQVDFGKGPTIKDVFSGEELSTWVFVMTLAWSRHQYAEIVTDQKVATWLGCHRRAFEFFGGVVHKVIIDNAKCAITKACFRDPVVQRAYGECAEGYGFIISPCPPADPKKKGRVESGVKYIKRNFMPLRDFRNLTDANRQLKDWILQTAGNRIHGTTKQKPLSAFIETEKPLLAALPDVVPELATWAKVKLHGNCHVQFENRYYSAPFRLVHRQLWLKATETCVKLFRNLELVAVHPRLKKPGARSTIDDHLPPEALAYKMQDPQWCLKQAAQIGPGCRALIEQLFSDRVLDNLRAAQGIVGFAKKYGNKRLEAACRRALFFDNPKYRAVKIILKKGLDQEPCEQSAFDRLGEAYTGKGRFSRNIKTLLIQ